MDTSCAYSDSSPEGPSPPGTPVPIMDGLSTHGQRKFTAGGAPCLGSISIVASSGPTASLHDADLSNWSCSVHAFFDHFPSDWTVLALATDPSVPLVYSAKDVDTGATVSGAPYILVSGGGVVIKSNIALTPATATNPVGGTHMVTATVTRGTSPEAGKTVTFNVDSGPNVGKTGTGVTDVNGQATFTYTDTGGAGTDSISATFVDDAGALEKATATKIWVSSKASPTISTSPSGTVAAGGVISDSATLAGGASPSGMITFSLFGPGDTACKTVIATKTATVAGNGTYSSGNVMAATVGTYNWVASYSGDTSNNGATSGCGAETVVVTKANPTIKTSPSATVPAGGVISDSATLTGGASPSGMITFSLFGPGDTACKTVIATKTATAAGNGTYGSGNVPAATAGTYNWVASYSGDTGNNGAVSGCGAETVAVTPQVLTGRAFGISLGGLIGVSPTPDTGHVATTSASTTSTPCVATANALGALAAQVLCANVTTTLGPPGSTAKASVAATTLGILFVPAIRIGAVQSSSTTSCAGSSGSITIASLTVGGVVVVPSPTSVAPNTTINVGVLKIVLNEQIPITGSDKGLTVNAVDVTALGGAVNLIVASASSDIGNCP